MTCKSLAASAIASPHLRAAPWTPWLSSSEDRFPSRHLLIQRLAHGWTDKSRLRYCQKCERILPRETEYFEQRVQRSKKKSLPWGIKTCMEKDRWKKLSNKKRYEHIYKLWTESGREDSSVFSCNRCWTREFNVEPPILNPLRIRERDLEKNISHKEGPIPTPQVPVECPCCVVDSLLNTYKEPRKSKFRPWLWKWTKKTFSFVGNTILVIIYLIYLLFKTPVDLGIWLWKKKKSRGWKCRSIICMK